MPNSIVKHRQSPKRFRERILFVLSNNHGWRHQLCFFKFFASTIWICKGVHGVPINEFGRPRTYNRLKVSKNTNFQIEDIWNRGGFQKEKGRDFRTCRVKQRKLPIRELNLNQTLKRSSIRGIINIPKEKSVGAQRETCIPVLVQVDVLHTTRIFC